MVTTNLSTRPFYNERAVRAMLLGLLALTLVLAALSGWWALSLRREEQSLSSRATAARDEAARLRAEAQRMTAQIDPREQEQVASAATEANNVIAQRTFSWGALLADLEATLPDNVRVTAMQPRVENGVMRVSLSVETISPEELAAFMDAMDARGTFSQVLQRDQTAHDDVIEAAVDVVYAPASSVRPKSAAAATRGAEEAARRE